MLLSSRSPWSKFVITVVYVLLAWSLSVSASGTRTVTQRNTRRGVSSLRYRFGRFLPGVDPLDRDLSVVYSRPSASASASPSPTPTATSTRLQGCIQVRADNDTALGYLMNTPQGLNGVTTNQTNKLSVTLDISKSSLAPSALVDIRAQNPRFPGSDKLGGITVARNASPNLAVNSSNAVLLSNVAQTAPGSRPVSTSQGAVESAIWTLNQTTGQLTAHWINSNGQSPTTFITYSQNNNTLYLTGEQPSSPGNASNANLISVTFFLDH